MAHESARLWTRVNLANPERAKLFVELSRNVGLHVEWIDRTLQGTTGSRDFIWPHSGRFVTLQLQGTSWLVRYVLDRIEEELPALQHVTIEASLVLKANIPLTLKFPELVSLTLR